MVTPSDVAISVGIAAASAAAAAAAAVSYGKMPQRHSNSIYHSLTIDLNQMAFITGLYYIKNYYH